MLREEEESTEPKVTLYHKKRANPFLKQPFNENHIPHQGGYAKIRKNKPRLAAWDAPKFDWPPKLSRPTMHKGKTLINELDAEEKKRIVADRDFKIPDYRTGDVLKFTVVDSLSENNEKTYSGVCISKKAPNSIRAMAKINFSIDNVNCTYGMTLYNPMLKNIEI